MGSKARHRRTPDQHCPRWEITGTGVAIAVGGAMAAAFVSTGTASADDLLGPAGGADAVTQLVQTTDLTASTAAAVPAQATDAVTQLLQTVDPSAVTAAAVPAATLDAWEQLVLTIDPSAFDATGNPTDFLGQFAVQIDTDLATTAFGPELNTIAGQVSCLIAVPPTCTDVITPPTTGDNGFTVLEQFLTQTYFPTALPLEFDPVLVADLNTIASDLDAYFAPTVWGPEIFTIASQIVAGL